MKQVVGPTQALYLMVWLYSVVLMSNMVGVKNKLVDIVCFEITQTIVTLRKMLLNAVQFGTRSFYIPALTYLLTGTSRLTILYELFPGQDLPIGFTGYSLQAQNLDGPRIFGQFQNFLKLYFPRNSILALRQIDRQIVRQIDILITKTLQP